MKFILFLLFIGFLVYITKDFFSGSEQSEKENDDDLLEMTEVDDFLGDD